MSNETKTNDTTAQIAFLAQHMSECPCVAGKWEEGEQIGCVNCRGKQAIVTFERLRRECPKCSSFFDFKTRVDSEKAGTPLSQSCIRPKWDVHKKECKGWLPVPLESVDVGKLLVEAARLPQIGSLDLMWDERGWWLEINGFAYTSEFENQAQAVLAAIHEFLQPRLAPTDNDISQPSD